jgi:hypothetical protein
MFNKIEISIMRAFFWPVANLAYWGLIFLAWWDTRAKVFLGASMFAQLSDRKGFAAVMGKLVELEAQARVSLAQSGPMPDEFMMIPLVMAVVLFLTPFVVRRDYKGPVTGVVVLPAMTLLCFVFASVINLIAAAAMGAGIHYLLSSMPGSDIFMFMVHPLYLAYPLMENVPGFLSQCVYLAYVGSVLATESKESSEYGWGDDGEEEEFDDSGPDDDWDKSACLMEMDRLTRILNSKFDSPPFVKTVRADVAEHVNRPSQIRGEVKLGLPHYKIVLTEAKNSLRRILDGGEKPSGAAEAFVFIVDEMERMDYISAEDALAMKSSLETPEEKTASLEKALGRILKNALDKSQKRSQEKPPEDSNGG